MRPVSRRQASAGARSEGALTLVRSATWRTVLLLLVVSAGVNLLMLAPSLYMMQVYDRVIATGHLDTLLYLTVMALGALGLLALLDWARGVASHRLAAWVDETLATEVVGASINAVHLAGAGQSVQGLRDLATIRGTIAGGALTPLFDLPWMPVFFLVVFLIHPLLGWLGVSGAIVLAMLAVANDLVSNGRVRRAGAATISAIGEADAAVRNTDAIVAMGMLPGLLRRWRPLHDAASSPQTAAGEGSAGIAALAKFLRLGLQVGILALGAWLVIKQEITGGTMIAASIMIGRAVAPLEQAIGTWRGLVSARAAYARLCRLLEEVAMPHARMALPAPAGALRAERVTYTLPGGKEPLLRQISFALRPGESLGLIGPSGAGKTTLARMLVGSLAPQTGWVLLDNAQLGNWGTAAKLNHIGYLPQDIELFQATVRDNIARLADVGDADVVQAAQLAGAHEMIMGLPQGYETIIGPGGVMLSGGQRQRIGLARAVFGQPRLVVLDEPNSNLDADGEQALVTALRRLKAAKATVVFIAQRMSLIGEADKLLMLRAGTVEAFGPREEVFARVARPLAVAAGGEGHRALRAVPASRDAGNVS